MDQQQFDTLARNVAAATSRRRLLAGLAGATLGGVFGRSQGAAAACPEGHVDRRRVGCVCQRTGRPPGPDGCPCPNGTASCPSGCVDLVGDPGNCGGCDVVCAGGHCEQGVCLKDLGEPCAGAGECASRICALPDGVCCDQPCDNQCQSCSLPDFAGRCRPLSDTPCEDGNLCTTGDVCRDGARFNTVCCGGTCCPPEKCRIAECDPLGQSCSYGKVADGTACGSSGVCCADQCCEATSGDCYRPVCTAGVCSEEPVPHGEDSPNPECGTCCGACSGLSTQPAAPASASAGLDSAAARATVAAP